MQITCNQFEGLLSFYIDGELTESLKQTFEEHLNECPHCNMKYKLINSIINDIKGAYNQITENTNEECIEAEVIKPDKPHDDISETELSAYIDNELPDESNIKIRKNMIAKPELRNKLEKMYKLKKVISDSFTEHKGKLKYDYSRDIVKTMNKSTTSKEAYLHCVLFVVVVILSLILSALIVIKVI